MVVFTIASMLCGVAPNAGLLVVARIGQAVGAAALVPASLALVLQTFPRQKIPMAVAVWGAVGAVAGAAGPTLGAFVVEHFGWRWAFFINLPVGIVSVMLGRRVLPEGRESNPGRLPDPAGVVLLAAGLALTAYAIVQTDVWGWGSARFLGTLTVALALIAVFVWRCSRVPNPLVDLSLFRARNFRWANAAMVVFATGFNAMFLGNVLFLTRVWEYSIMEAGLAISVGPMVVAVMAPFFGRLAGRIGQRRLLIPGGLVWAAGGAFLLAFATTTPDYVGTYLPAVLLTGLGVALCLPQLSSAAVQGSAGRPVRLGLGDQPGDPQPRCHVRRRPRRRVHRGVGGRRAARRLPPGLVVAGRQWRRRLAAGHPSRTRRQRRPKQCPRRSCPRSRPLAATPSRPGSRRQHEEVLTKRSPATHRRPSGSRYPTPRSERRSSAHGSFFALQAIRPATAKGGGGSRSGSRGRSSRSGGGGGRSRS